MHSGFVRGSHYYTAGGTIFGATDVYELGFSFLSISILRIDGSIWADFLAGSTRWFESTTGNPTTDQKKPVSALLHDA